MRPSTPVTGSFRGYDDAKARFFRLDARTIENHVEQMLYRYYRDMGAYLRRIARNSMRPARPYRSIKQLPPAIRSAYFRAYNAWVKRGKQGPAPRLPSRPSKPGTPPRSRAGYLRNSILFALDPVNRSVVVGPVRFPASGENAGEVPRLHEHGGTGKSSLGTIARFPPRPYMRPALAKTLDKVGVRFLREAAAATVLGRKP